MRKAKDDRRKSDKCYNPPVTITGIPSKFISRPFSYPEPFLRAARRGALAKSITGYHKNMVRKQCPVLELANQMPVRIWIWPEPLVAPCVRRALGTRMFRGLNTGAICLFSPYFKLEQVRTDRAIKLRNIGTSK